MTITNPAIEIAALDGVAQADLVRRGEVTSTELVQWAIERIELLNPTLNAVITPLCDQALAAAAVVPPTGPFAGIPYLVKDLVAEVAGAPFSEGSRFVRGTVSHYDSELVCCGSVGPGCSSWARPTPRNSGWCRPVSPSRSARPATRGTPTDRPADPVAGRPRPAPRGWCRWRTATISVGRCATRHRRAACSG